MLKAAAYCRVSTDKNDQANSFESQQNYFKDYIKRQSEWELYEIYADEGISGTSTKKRLRFHQMIADAHMGKFHMILTKEVSRFSRNILDTISYTRELKALGISVIFMNDGITTSDADAELRLSIMASLAQEESRKTSERVKWGQSRRMEQGIVFGHSMLGYDIKNGKMTINPQGAELVKLIFQKYGNEKKGSSVIAKELYEAGYQTYSGSTKWHSSHIIKILKNEKYVGDLIQKKTITPDYLTHEKKYNHGEESYIRIQNHHEPIIDRALWNLVQEELKNRNLHNHEGNRHSNRYIFSGKIKCGACGHTFISRQRKRKDGSSYQCWGCSKSAAEGRIHIDSQGHTVGCNIGKMLRNDLAINMVNQALQTIQFNETRLLYYIRSILTDSISACKKPRFDVATKLETDIKQLLKKKQHVLDAFFSESITKEEMQMMKKLYDTQLNELQNRLETIHFQTTSFHSNDILSCLAKSEVFYKNIVEQIIVYPDLHAELTLHLLPQTWIFTLS